jgi:hypothetical protein
MTVRRLADSDRGYEPLRIRLHEERHARALESQLAALAPLELEQRDGGWEVTVGGFLGDKLVVSVLNAVSNALAGDTTATALVHLNGREYQLQGE